MRTATLEAATATNIILAALADSGIAKPDRYPLSELRSGPGCQVGYVHFRHFRYRGTAGT